MPLPIDVNSDVAAFAAAIDSTTPIEVFMDAVSDSENEAVQRIAARRAQLEDAETLRRMRAL